jgi:hypothetical protein
MSRKTRKTSPDGALRSTSGLDSMRDLVDQYASGRGGSPANQKEMAPAKGSTIWSGETDAKDQWGIGAEKANNFRNQMRHYDTVNRFTSQEAESQKPPSARRARARSF